MVYFTITKFQGYMVSSKIRQNMIWCKSRNIVITGSTSGIGKSLARQFVHNGDNVIITSRNEKKVHDTCL